MDLIDLNGYGSKSIKGYRFILVVFDNISKPGCTILLTNENAGAIKRSSENVLRTSKKNKF